jgi:hypothetical protein
MLLAAWVHMSGGIMIWLDPSDPSGGVRQAERQAYHRADISVQTPSKPKEEFYKNELTGNIHICCGLWTPLALDEIAKKTQTALEGFLSESQSQSQSAVEE